MKCDRGAIAGDPHWHSLAFIAEALDVFGAFL